MPYSAVFTSFPRTTLDASLAGGWRAWVMTLLLMLPATALAQGATHRHTLNIKAAPLADVLREFSLQTGLLLGYLPFDQRMEALPRPALQGQYTADEALAHLLAGSGLSHHWVNADMLAIGPAAPTEPAGPAVAGRAVPATQPQTLLPLREEITVWSRLLRPLETDGTEVVSIDRERIDEIGAPTLPELLRYLSQSAFTRPEGYRTSGAQYAELRGLGADTTLVLINGRRTFPSANSLSSSAFDLNTVPITAVERVDILLDSASVAHGTDAIGGIVNIVLRQRHDESSVQLRHGGAAGGADQHRITVNAGLNRQRFSSTVVLDAFDLEGLHGRQRERWRDQDFRRLGGADQRSLTASPGNIEALPGELLPGLAHGYAAVPATVSGPVPTLADYQGLAGQRNHQSLFEHWSIVPSSRRLSAMALGKMSFDERHRLSAEALYVRREASFDFLPPAIGGLRVPAGNAFNPFDRDVLFHGQLTGLRSQSHRIDSDLLRSALVMEGGGGRWQWEASVMHSWERASSWLEGALDASRLAQAVASDDPHSALNLFGGPMGSSELLQALVAAPQANRFASGGTQLSAALSGSLIELPAGAMTLLAGAQWREERARFEQVAGSFGRQVHSGYLQLSAPLAGRAGVPGLHALSLTAGVRLDGYSDAGRILRPQYGLSWMPRADMTLRVSTGRSLRPPSLYELHFPRIAFPWQLTDPARNDESVVIMLERGGRSDLRVTDGSSVNLGLTWHPAVFDARFSVDYWRLDIDDRLSLLPPDVILANEELFASRVRREPASLQEGAGELRGRLVAIDSSAVNAGWLKTSGIDLGLDWRFTTSVGVFQPRLEATWVARFVMADVVSQQPTNRVGQASMLGSITRWRAVASLGWRSGPYRASLMARHTPSYADHVDSTQAGRDIKAQTLFDIQAALAVGTLWPSGGWSDGMALTLGAMNVMDSAPPFAQVNLPAGYDPSQGDLKQRHFYLQLSKEF